MGFGGYLLRRLLLVVPTLAGVTVISFALTYLLPGNPALVKAGALATPDVVREIERQMGLDRPVPVQYWRYVSGLLRGDHLGDPPGGRRAAEQPGCRDERLDVGTGLHRLPHRLYSLHHERAFTPPVTPLGEQPHAFDDGIRAARDEIGHRLVAAVLRRLGIEGRGGRIEVFGINVLLP